MRPRRAETMGAWDNVRDADKAAAQDRQTGRQAPVYPGFEYAACETCRSEVLAFTIVKGRCAKCKGMGR